MSKIISTVLGSSSRTYLTTQDLGYSEENKIYLAESLTERNQMLFKDCLKVKKDMEFKFIWTLNGKIFMTKDKDSVVHHINNKEDLYKMQARQVFIF